LEGVLEPIEIINISRKCIVFLQDFVIFKTFLGKKAQKGLKEGSKDADVNEGKFVFNTDV
jgi:hypothetical protein